ncbi:hypothetical protein FNF31_02616 [Cafeteria roenbergensis]|uniref:NAD(P)H-hydrate epimerase n=1 Tax=Cafeteria roenbergensis TaxID=33653 RepID=A0A5A8DEH4_CAFRO|nr:hypothetical protein FNF31_02616 [Cafeteria roenbergensis]
MRAIRQTTRAASAAWQRMASDLAPVPMSAAAARASSGLSLLRADDAASVDAELMSSPGFSVDQLMELAGLAVATAVHKEFEGLAAERGGCLRVLVLCGPGNNGGDGLVAARHLAHFGHKPAVVYPRMGSSDEAKRLFGNLLRQLEDLDVPVVRDATPYSADVIRSSADVVVDALFGFSFKPPAREPFASLLAAVAEAASPAEADGECVRLASVDVPSGWEVNDGPQEGSPALSPHCVVSLTAPKPFARRLGAATAHWLGGRFVPPSLARRFGIEGYAALYPAAEQVVRLDPAAMPW